MKDGEWYNVKEVFENALYKFKDAVKEDGRDLEEELTESLNAVIGDDMVEVMVY